MSGPPHTSRLCIYCRKLEPIESMCPSVDQYRLAAGTKMHEQGINQLSSGLSASDAQLIRQMQAGRSQLCERCSDFGIIRAFKESQPLAQNHRKNPDSYGERMKIYRLFLGAPSTVLLIPSCPFCRLLYSIMPREYSPDELQITVEPYRSYIRRDGWDWYPEILRDSCAVFLGLATNWSPLAPISAPLRHGDENFRHGMMTGPAIALHSQHVAPDCSWMNARQIDGKLQLHLLVEPLKYCELNHDPECSITRPAELLTTLMVDVVSRIVVPCPENCDYIALSYVWGGVQPEPGALARRCLPQTIEDAITVTIALGRRYLWVNALCIDQSAKPSPEVLAKKIQQLNLMATIYGSATLTIVAVTGENANAGLSGVSVVRPEHIGEVVEGHKLLIVPPSSGEHHKNSKWFTRAWTLQENFLSRRNLYFGESQVQYVCLGTAVEESIRIQNVLQDVPIPSHQGEKLVRLIFQAPSETNLEHDSDGRPGSATVEGSFSFYAGLVNQYTSRDMTNESDSLNAVLGLLAGLQKNMFPRGFTFGLPARTHPRSLGWIHDRLCRPKRRSMFPSWSWTGWEGAALYPDDLIYTLEADVSYDFDLALEINLMDDRTLVVRGWVADLDIVTEPFSEVIVAGQPIATVMERNFLHNNTIPTGRYSCLIIQRGYERRSNVTPPRQKAFMLILNWAGSVARRQTFITISPFRGLDIMQIKPKRQTITLI